MSRKAESPGSTEAGLQKELRTDGANEGGEDQKRNLRQNAKPGSENTTRHTGKII